MMPELSSSDENPLLKNPHWHYHMKERVFGHSYSKELYFRNLITSQSPTSKYHHVEARFQHMNLEKIHSVHSTAKYFIAENM